MLRVYAQDLYSNNENIENILNNNIYEPNYFSMFLGLFLVIGLVYLTSILYQKLIKIKTNQSDNPFDIEIISTTPLGQNKNLHIIKINNEYSLIASSQNNINYLKEIKPEENKQVKQGE